MINKFHAFKSRIYLFGYLKAAFCAAFNALRIAWFEMLEWKNYRAPFVIEKDNMYYKSLKQKYDDLIKDMKSAAVDTKHIVTVELYSKTVIEALDDYYQGDIFGAQAKVNELL